MKREEPMEKETNKRHLNMNGTTAQLVGEVLDARKSTEAAPSVDDLPPWAKSLLAKAGAKVPSWAKYAIGAGGSALALQLVAIWGGPQRMDEFEKVQEK